MGHVSDGAAYDVNTVAFANDSRSVLYSAGDDGLCKAWASSRKTTVLKWPESCNADFVPRGIREFHQILPDWPADLGYADSARGWG
jgi:hypothetical protein